MSIFLWCIGRKLTAAITLLRCAHTSNRMANTPVLNGLAFVLATITLLTSSPAEAQKTPNINVMTQLGHSGPIELLVFSTNGKQLLSSDNEGTLKIWDVASGQLLRTFPETGESSVFFPDGSKVLSRSLRKSGSIKILDASTGRLLRAFDGQQDIGWEGFSADASKVLSRNARDGSLTLWDAATGRLVRSFQGHQDLFQTLLSRDGGRLLSGGHGKLLELWNTNTGALLQTYKPAATGYYTPAEFSRDGSKLILCGVDGKTLRLVAADTGQILHTLDLPACGLRVVAFSPDGSKLITGNGFDSAMMWDATTGQLLRTFEGGGRNLQVSPDGSRMLSGGGYEKRISIWDIATGKPVRIFELKSGVTAVAFTPDGRGVVSGDDNGVVTLWDVATGQRVNTFSGKQRVDTAIYSPDGTKLLSSDGGGLLALWDTTTGQLLRCFGRKEDGRPSAVIFSPDGRLVLSSGRNHTLRLWDVATAKLLRTFEGKADGEATSLAFSPDNRSILAGREQGTFKLWDIASGRLLRGFQNASIVFSADGKRLIAGGSIGGAINLIDATSGQLVRTIRAFSKGGFVTSVAIAPDNGKVLVGTVGDVELLDAATGQLLGTFQGDAKADDSPWFVAFSPDGDRALLASANSNPRLWNVSTGRLLATFEGATLKTTAFSSDGRRVLSVSDQGMLKLWDAATGQLLRTFEPRLLGVNTVTISPNGRSAVLGMQDGTLRIWSLSSGSELVKMVASSERDWLTITPDGFFLGPDRESNLLAIVRGSEATTIGQVHQSLFYPDLIREALADDAHGNVRRAATVINLEKLLDSGPAPSVVVTSHKPGSRSRSDVVTVMARITDRGKRIGRIEWRLNGVTSGVMNVPTGPGPAYDVSQEVALDPGENLVEVIAYEGRNLLASQPARTTIIHDGATNSVRQKLYILAVGINAYVDKGGKHGRFLPLKGSVPDAKAFSEALAKAGMGQYDQVKVTLALDEDATLAKLDEAVNSIGREIGPRDTFVLYAAAHGYSFFGNYYLIPQDYQGGGSSFALNSRAVSQERIQMWLASRIRAKRAVILLDTCESGALTSGYARSRTEETLSEAAVGRLHEAIGRPIITAASPGKSAYENYKGHGVFTYALIEALHQGDTNNNGKIEVTELAAHAARRVPELFAELKQSGWVVKGVSARGGTGDAQTAHFGSTGENFSVVGRLTENK